MNREIKFRGMRTIQQHNTKEWVYFELEEYPETIQMYRYVTHIAQYTGLKDENGVEIYEGDIVKTESGLLYQIVCTSTNSGFEWYSDTFAVVGNIYENEELLK